VLRAIENALAPKRCVFCGVRTQVAERFVCIGCNDDLPYIESPPPPAASLLEVEIAPLAYEFPVDAAIRAYKLRRKLFYSPALADFLLAEIPNLPEDIDAVLPVPLHWWRQWRRGFNQALELGRPVAKRLDVPLIRNVSRRRATSFQSGLSAKERAQNLRMAFVARGAVSYRHVLIVDDVITTGTTVRQLAKAVQRAGARKVSALAVARAQGRPLP
jgi:ComF family protein